MKQEELDMQGQAVVDAEGAKVGEVIDFYVDAATGEPEWLMLEAGLLDHRRALVPLEGIARREDGLTTPYPKDLIMEAPTVEGASIDKATERALYEHYHVRRELPGRTENRAAFEQDRSETGDFRLRSWKASHAA